MLFGVRAEMTAQFICPFCHQILTVPRALAGIEGPCPNCESIIRAPDFDADLKLEPIEAARPGPTVNFVAKRSTAGPPPQMETGTREHRDRMRRQFRIGEEETLVKKLMQKRWFRIGRVVFALIAVGVVAYTFFYARLNPSGFWWDARPEPPAGASSGIAP